MQANKNACAANSSELGVNHKELHDLETRKQELNKGTFPIGNGLHHNYSQIRSLSWQEQGVASQQTTRR
jgi:hypothetical protein